MRTTYLFLILVFIISCGQRRNDTDNSYELVDSQINSTISGLKTLSGANLIDSSKKQTINRVLALYDNVIDSSENKAFLIDSLKKMLNHSGGTLMIDNKKLVQDLDSMSVSSDVGLRLRLNKLCFLQKAYMSIVGSDLIFKQYEIVQIKKDNNSTDLYFTAKLDSTNSYMGFAVFDTVKKELIQDTLTHVFNLTHGHYNLVNSKQPNVEGYIKFKKPNGTFHYYPFNATK